MPITIGTNIPSIQGQRRLSKTTDQLENVFQRLSSGQRINRAADDAAGLAIADDLRAKQRVASVGIRNANDGISLISIADSALAEISNVLVRMAELAEQSANGVFSNVQRSALANEFNALGSEVERIAVTTEFNDIKLLSAANDIVFQVGFEAASTSQITVVSLQATLANLGLASTGTSILSYSLNASSTINAQSAARQALDAVTDAISSLSSTRGTLGAAESRLRVAINNLSVAKETFAAAESRIRDADVAAEAAELTRLNILQQASSAVLGQANQQPQLALQLIGG